VPRPTLPESLATPESRGRYVRRLFATIADRYDLITRVLSCGRDAAWKRRLVAMSGAEASTQALDLACGTGDIAFGLAGRGARVFGLDITVRMLQLAHRKGAASPGSGDPRPARHCPQFLAGDMLALPFGDGEFDLVTAGYGLRNVPLLDPAIAEIRRVLRPGGLLLSLDFDRPPNPAKRAIYLAYLTLVGSALGWILHRDPDTYRYIPESIKRYPGADRVSAMLSRAGFEDCRVVPLLAGFMAINVARKR